MMKRTAIRSLLVLSLCASSAGNAFAPTNFFRAYDNAVKLPCVGDVKLKFGARFEYGDAKTGLNANHQRRNVLALYDDTQSALEMLRNESKTLGTNQAFIDLIDSMTTPFALANPPGDDSAQGGTRGRQQLAGRFSEFDTTFFGSYDFCLGDCGGVLSLSLDMPVVCKKIDQVKINDLTPVDPLDVEKVATHVLTDNLAANTKAISNLDLSNWNKTSIGDITALLTYKNMMCFDGDFFKHLAWMVKLGVVFPSAEKKDENRAFSMALGNDGAWAMPFGVGVKMMCADHIRLGVDGDVTVYFDETRVRRLKTNVNQTEFLLLNKGNATKKQGLLWQAHAFIELNHLIGGLSFKVDYQYLYQEKSKLVSKDAAFSDAIINSLNSLKPWETHNLIFSATYDFCAEREFRCGSCGGDDDKSRWHFVPQLQFFYKLGVEGKNLIDHDTVGGQLSINF